MTRFVGSASSAMQLFSVAQFETPGAFAIATSTHMKVVHSNGVSEEYMGSGFVTSGGEVSAGTITAMRQSNSAGVIFDITEFSLSATTFADWVGSGNTAAAQNFLYGGADIITGSAFADTLLGFGGADSISGGDGFDMIDGHAGNDTIDASGGNDTVRGFEDNDVINGGVGNDDVNGNMGEDTVRGGLNTDIVRGGQGNDLVYGDDGDDIHVNGNIGDDVVYGGDGNDSVFGGQGSDTLYGDFGVDRLSGDLGNDILFGGESADRFVILAGGGVDWVGDFSAAEGDRIQLVPGAAYTVENVGGQAFIGLGGGHGIGLTGVAFASFTADWVVFA